MGTRSWASVMAAVLLIIMATAAAAMADDFHYAAVDPTSRQWQRLIVLQPGQQATICVKGRWRVEPAGGTPRRWVGGAGYDLNTDLPSDQISLEGFNLTIPRLSVVYRATFASPNLSTSEPQYYVALYADQPDNDSDATTPKCADKAFYAPAGTTLSIDFMAADQPGYYGTHVSDPNSPLSVTSNVSAGQAPGGVRWSRIDQPVVTERLHEYRDQKFIPGQRIMVEAGGCVRTLGSMWLNYVEPHVSGLPVELNRQTARRFHGLLWIPGATPGPVRISSVIGKTLTIPADYPKPDDLFLRLGYEDFENHYNLNRYDGTPPGGTCGPAWVQITASDGSQRAGKAMDLVWSSTDDNWLPLQPMWQWQVFNDTLPSFPIIKDGHTDHWTIPAPGDSDYDTLLPTTQGAPSDFNDNLILGICANGPHVNWLPATYMGRIGWLDHASRNPIEKGDDDYNMALIPKIAGADAANGLTRGNVVSNESDPELPMIDGVAGLLLEFQANETVDYMNAAAIRVGSWWRSFHSAVDEGKPWRRASDMVKNHDAVVTGLVGLDCEHDCQTELHPVWALAIREEADPAASPQHWAVFVKTFGNEGSCSAESPLPLANNNPFSHYLDLPGNQYVLRIPRPWSSGVKSDPKFIIQPTKGGEPVPANVKVDSDGSDIVTTFSFGSQLPQQSHPIMYGELTLTQDDQSRVLRPRSRI